MVLLPVASYLIVKKVSDHAITMPMRFFADSVVEKVVGGKKISDTVWHRVANLRLINQLGDTVTLDDLRGKILVADFFFTRCPSICPSLTRNMRRLQTGMRMKDDIRKFDTSVVQFLSFSVDPERDSSEALRKYADKFGVGHDTWWLLTGPKKTIYDFALNDLKLGLQDGGTVDSNFIHTAKFILLDRDRVVRGYYNGLDSTDLSKLAEDVTLLMLEKDKKKKRSIF